MRGFQCRRHVSDIDGLAKFWGMGGDTGCEQLKTRQHAEAADNSDPIGDEQELQGVGRPATRALRIGFDGFRVLVKPQPAERGRIPTSPAAGESRRRRNSAAMRQLRRRLPIGRRSCIHRRLRPLQIKQETPVPAVAGPGRINYPCGFHPRDVTERTCARQNASISPTFQCNMRRNLGKACSHN